MVLSKKLLIYLRCIRYKELPLMLGAPFLGILFTLSKINIGIVLKIAFFLLPALLLGGHIYSLNDWFGLPFDRYDPRKRYWPSVSGEISSKELLILSLILGVLGLLLYGIFFPLRVLLIAVFGVTIFLFYVHPRILLKRIPIVSVFTNFFGGFPPFLLGYALFNNIEMRGILIGIYFGILSSAGQLNHEIIDYETDLKVGLGATAAIFGKRKVFLAGFIFFTLSSLYLCLLSLYGLILYPLALILIAAYPVFLYLFLKTLKHGINSENVLKFRINYRRLYAVVGLSMAIFLIMKAL